MIYEVQGMIVNVLLSSDMPVGMTEHVWQNHDGSYTIKLNAIYNFETLQESLLHAFGHIAFDDFSRTEESADVIEFDAHNRDLSSIHFRAVV